jgi:hypothetical protein
MPPPTLTALPSMTTAQLRRAYAEVFGETTRSGNRAWLLRRLAWRIQADQSGAVLSRAARDRAAELAPPDFRLIPPRTTPALDPAVTVPVGDARLPPPGTVLARTYKGRPVRVLVRGDGFEYDGAVYPSLSAVANAVTGSHLNGFRFFRLGGAA